MENTQNNSPQQDVRLALMIFEDLGVNCIAQRESDITEILFFFEFLYQLFQV